MTDCSNDMTESLNVVRHWVLACDVDPLVAASCVIGGMSARADNGFVVIENTPLSHPISLMSLEETLRRRLDLVKSLTLVSNDSYKGVSICAMILATPGIDQDLDAFASNAITMDAATDGAMCARRPDLQYIVSHAFAYMVLRLGRLTASSLITTASETVWYITSRGKFFSVLCDIITRAQIDTYLTPTEQDSSRPSSMSVSYDSPRLESSYCEPRESNLKEAFEDVTSSLRLSGGLDHNLPVSKSRRTAGIIIDGCATLHMLQRDRTLVVYLYAFTNGTCLCADAPRSVNAVASIS